MLRQVAGTAVLAGDGPGEIDEGAGFAPTALAEATVEVRAADAAPTKPAPAKASSSPKTGDLSPLAIGGLALAALLGAGALALSLARRRA